SETLITRGPVHGVGPEADARHSVVRRVDAGCALVRELVDAVVGRGRDRARGVVHGRRAGVGDRGGDAVPLRRLEDVYRADDVDAGSEYGVGLAKRHLEGGQMDDVGDRVPAQHGLELAELGHVSAHERDPADLLGARDQLQPAAVGTEVEGHRGNALADELDARPRADAAERARDEKRLVLAHRSSVTSAAAARQTRMRMRPALLKLSALGAAAAFIGAADATSSARATVVVRSSSFGSILFDGRGFALYAFTRDTRRHSNCSGVCASPW